MATTPLTALQTQVLGALTDIAATPVQALHILAAIHVMLYKRAGLSDEDTLFHLQKMVDQGIINPQKLPVELRIELGYSIR